MGSDGAGSFIGPSLPYTFPHTSDTQLSLQSNAYLLGFCNFWCDKAYPAYEILRGVQPDPSGFLEILPSVTSKSCERE